MIEELENFNEKINNFIKKTGSFITNDAISIDDEYTYFLDNILYNIESTRTLSLSVSDHRKNRLDIVLSETNIENIVSEFSTFILISGQNTQRLSSNQITMIEKLITSFSKFKVQLQQIIKDYRLIIKEPIIDVSVLNKNLLISHIDESISKILEEQTIQGKSEEKILKELGDIKKEIKKPKGRVDKILGGLQIVSAIITVGFGLPNIASGVDSAITYISGLFESTNIFNIKTPETPIIDVEIDNPIDSPNNTQIV